MASVSVPIIYETGTLDHAPPGLMDALWADGWRHFGRDFFRYSVAPGDDGGVQTIRPLRVPVSAFLPNKNQRRILRRNADAEVRVVPAVVDDEREDLFMRHRARFTSNVPESLRDFIPSPQPDRAPCECVSVEMRISGQLVAVSYLDVGDTAVSSVYAMFDPLHSRRSPGMLTLLEEIHWARAKGKSWLYPGYATHEPSSYDYKKSLRPLEYFDWLGNWKPLDP
jgi:arginyl-tRNA--protein-N-Asp/Glu arginylyltransferase